MRQIVLVLMAVAVAGTAVAQVPVKGADNLGSIVGTPTLITVVLKARDAEDHNLQIIAVQEEFITVVSESGQRCHYRFADVKEIRVQEGTVEIAQPSRLVSRALTAEQEAILQRAVARVGEIFRASNENQTLKMSAARLMILAGDEKVAQTGREYLTKLASSNDTAISVMAAGSLHSAGEEVPPNVVSRGMDSGNVVIRAAAALLAGMTNDVEARQRLLTMLQDRSADYATPAAIALGLMGDRDTIPALLTMLSEPVSEKGEAAVFALVALGGDRVIEGVKLVLKNASGLPRFRAIKVLFMLDDPEGKKLLQEEGLTTPSLKMDAALMLAPTGDINAMQILRDRLEERYEPDNIEFIKMRVRALIALVAANDRTVLGELMETRRSEHVQVQAQVYCGLIQLGNVNLMSVAQPGIESPEDVVAITAAETCIALAKPEVRQRVLMALALVSADRILWFPKAEAAPDAE